MKIRIKLIKWGVVDYSPCLRKLLGWGWGVGFTPSIRLSVCLLVCPTFRVCSVTPRFSGWILFIYAQMITSMRGCVVHKDLWPWPISSRSFRHDLAIKLLKYGTSCHVCSTECTVLDGFFAFLAQMITSIRGCVAWNDLWPWPISSWLFSHDCNKTAKIWHILRCLLCSMYSSGWILYLFGTNDH